MGQVSKHLIGISEGKKKNKTRKRRGKINNDTLKENF